MPNTGIVKYHVKLSFEVDGLVERADIIGAIFGQTEGLLGPEMNLNELQRVSKVGRIDVNTFTTESTTKGDVLLPMSTDIDTCSLISFTTGLKISSTLFGVSSSTSIPSSALRS